MTFSYIAAWLAFAISSFAVVAAPVLVLSTVNKPRWARHQFSTGYLYWLIVWAVSGWWVMG